MNKERPTETPEGWGAVQACDATGIQPPSNADVGAFMLFGPHEVGGQAILHPGGWILAPEVDNPDLELIEYDDEVKFSYGSLRHVIWTYGKDAIPTAEEVPAKMVPYYVRRMLPILNGRQPTSITEITIPQAVDLLRNNAPDLVGHIEDFVLQRLSNITAFTIALTFYIGNVEGAVESAQQASQLGLDMVEAFGEDWYSEHTATYHREDWGNPKIKIPTSWPMLSEKDIEAIRKEASITKEVKQQDRD